MPSFESLAKTACMCGSEELSKGSRDLFGKAKAKKYGTLV